MNFDLMTKPIPTTFMFRLIATFAGIANGLEGVL